VADLGYGRRRQREIYLAGLRGHKPRVSQNAVALERAAERAMTREGFAYIAGGAGLETTMTANREAFERVRIVPRMLRGTESRDLTVELFWADALGAFPTRADRCARDGPSGCRPRGGTLVMARVADVPRPGVAQPALGAATTGRDDVRRDVHTPDAELGRRRVRPRGNTTTP
jgi:hypothetical protein